MKSNRCPRFMACVSGWGWVVLTLVGLASFPGLGIANGTKGEEKKTIPPLEQTVSLAWEHYSQKQEQRSGRGSRNSSSDSRSRADIRYQVQKFYYQIQYKGEQLGIAEEVKGHFEKAVNKSQEKFDQGDIDISQAEITKLKLGLSGTLHDIIELEKEIKTAKLRLGHLLGWPITSEWAVQEEGIQPVEFKMESFDAYFGTLRPKTVPSSVSPPNRAQTKGKNSEGVFGEKLLELKEAFWEVQAAKDKLELAKDTRKITRVLLVTEVANYDFGLGDPGDLFEALIIYTRVLRGYYDSVNHLNMAVAELERQEALF